MDTHLPWQCMETKMKMAGPKRKNDSNGDSDSNAIRTRMEEPRGEKRGPDQMEGDGDMGAW